jgi:hypothetical protein
MILRFTVRKIQAYNTDACHDHSFDDIRITGSRTYRGNNFCGA